MDNQTLQNYITLFNEGDENAFYKIVDRYKDEIFNLCYRMLNDYDEANDVSQDSFIKIYTSLNSFRFDSSFSTWIYRIAINCCNTTLSKRKKRQTTSIDEMDKDFEDSSYDYNDDKAYSNIVREAIEKLEQKHKAVIILRDIEGMSYDEIAEVLSVNRGTVKSRLARAREKLKEILRRYL